MFRTASSTDPKLVSERIIERTLGERRSDVFTANSRREPAVFRAASCRGARATHNSAGFTCRPIKKILLRTDSERCAIAIVAAARRFAVALLPMLVAAFVSYELGDRYNNKEAVCV